MLSKKGKLLYNKQCNSNLVKDSYNNVIDTIILLILLLVIYNNINI